MTLELLRTLGVGGVDTRIEQATPRARKRDENGDVRSGLENFCDLRVSTLGGKVVLLGDIDDFALVGVRISLLHVRLFIGAKQHHSPLCGIF